MAPAKALRRRLHAAGDAGQGSGSLLGSSPWARAHVNEGCPVYCLATACERLSFTMSDDAATRMTMLIEELRQGNTAARDELVARVYPELRRIAAHYMRQERPGHTLRTTGLINEMYLRLFGGKSATESMYSRFANHFWRRRRKARKLWASRNEQQSLPCRKPLFQESSTLLQSWFYRHWCC